jgi:hypothetical protein
MTVDSSRQQFTFRLLLWTARGLGLALLAVLFTISGRDASRLYAQTPALPLNAGWNNVLYAGPPGPVPTALASLGSGLSAVVIWDATAQRWHTYYPGASPQGDIQTMLPGQVYWVDVIAATVLPPGVAATAPVQLLPGWNNVAYLGPGMPGSSVLEQTPVWSWDGPTQKWLYRDPTKPGSSDFQALTTLRAYWVDITAGSSNTTAPAPNTASSAPPSPAATSNGCYPFTAMQPAQTDIDDAISRAGSGTLHVDPALEPAAEHVGTDGSAMQQPAYVPPTILRSIGWIETRWHQATWSVQPGQSGPALASDGCAYGVMQIATGMSISGTPTSLQQLIGSDYRANIEAGAQLLTKNWNWDSSALPYLGRHDPHVLEDWYFAIWAYHCFGDSCGAYGAHDNPDDPSLPWPRPMYDSPQQLSSSTSLTYADYPYEELVYGLVSNPPSAGGHQLWQPIALQLPQHGAIGFPEPHAAAEASAHLDNGTSLAVYAPGSAPASAPLASSAPSTAPRVIGPTGTPIAGG